jgi:hypothetical protein
VDENRNTVVSEAVGQRPVPRNDDTRSDAALAERTHRLVHPDFGAPDHGIVREPEDPW